MQFDSPEYKAFSAEYSKPGYWAATGLASIIIMLNVNNVKPPDIPTSWWDLTKPVWKDNLVIDNLEVSGTGYNWLYDIVGPAGPGWDLVTAIGKNKPSLERGHAGIAQKVASGEYAAAIEMTDFHLYALLKRSPNAPVRGAWPKEGVPQEVWTGGIFKRAPHPNAAKLFQTFMLSQEGQNVYTQAMGRTSARADVAKAAFPNRPDEVKFIHRADDELLKARPGLVAKWKQAWGLN
jgi:iron(III) transport system substrate-binding protein